MGYPRPEDFYELPHLTSAADEFLAQCARGLPGYHEPHRGGFLGDVTLEWFRGGKSLTVSFCDGEKPCALYGVMPDGGCISELTFPYDGDLPSEGLAGLWRQFMEPNTSRKG